MPRHASLDRSASLGSASLGSASPELPGWIARELPDGWRTRDVATRGERIAVLEWGPADGHAILLVHGNPTWGFLWRRVVAAVRARPDGAKLRLVVPDLVGLGRSSRPPASAYTLANHGAWLGDAVAQLIDGPLVLVAQDWGGAIGLAALAEQRAKLCGMVLGNTAVGPPAKGFKPTLFHRLARAPLISKLLFERLGFPLGVLHRIQGDPQSIRGVVARAYRWPLAHVKDRAAPLALARMVPDSHDRHPSVPTLQVTEEIFRDAKVPVALVWGTKDPILGRVVNHLARLRPDASVVKTDAGHFLQEEVPELLADAIVDVAARASWAPARRA